jgi:hypothetical protein
MRARSSVVAARVRRIASGEKIREGPTPRMRAAAATAPAWPICAEIAAPSACTTSAIRRSPGTASRVSTISLGVPQPSFETAQ